MPNEFEQQMLDRANKLREQRPVYEYTMPPDVAKKSGVTVIGLVEITAQEQEDAIKRSRSDPGRLITELPKTSLRFANGQPLSLADGSVDKVWNALGPRGIQALTAAYGKINVMREEEVEDFLAGEVVRSG